MKRNMGKSVWMRTGSNDDGHWEWFCYKCWGKWEGLDPHTWLWNNAQEHISSHARRAWGYAKGLEELDSIPMITKSDGRQVADKAAIKSAAKLAAVTHLETTGEKLLVAFQRAQVTSTFLLQAVRDGQNNLSELQSHLITFESQWWLSPWQGFEGQQLLEDYMRSHLQV